MSRRKDEGKVFTRKPRLSRTSPGLRKTKGLENPFGRMDSVDLMGDEEDDDVFPPSVPGRGRKEDGPRKRKECLTLEEKMDISLRAIEKILITMKDHNAVLSNYILKRDKEVDPVLRDTYISMGCCLEEVIEAVDGLRP